jgi:hypothetical protein
MKKQIVFLASVLPGDISTTDGGHTKAVNLLPKGSQSEYWVIGSGECFARLISYGNTHPEFDALIEPGKQYTVKIEAVE